MGQGKKISAKDLGSVIEHNRDGYYMHPTLGVFLRLRVVGSVSKGRRYRLEVSPLGRLPLSEQGVATPMDGTSIKWLKEPALVECLTDVILKTATDLSCYSSFVLNGSGEVCH